MTVLWWWVCAWQDVVEAWFEATSQLMWDLWEAICSAVWVSPLRG